jgi:hypothetical protein
MNCDFQNDAKTCPRCGYVAKSLPTFRECRPVPAQQWRPIDVGELVERGLSAIGITKARIEKLTRTANKPGGCGCQRRKRWLTDAGNRAQYAARDAARAAHKFYFGN